MFPGKCWSNLEMSYIQWLRRTLVRTSIINPSETNYLHYTDMNHGIIKHFHEISLLFRCSTTQAKTLAL